MLIKTEPSVPEFEQRLSVREMTLDMYKDAVEILKDESYEPKVILSKRRAIPKFALATPVKLLADFDPQLEGADMVFILRSTDAQSK